MDKRKHQFLTLFFASVITGFLLATGNPFTNFEGYTQVDDVSVGENRISIHTECFRLDMTSSTNQGELLQQSIGGVNSEIPLTHEVISETAEIHGNEIERVDIHTVENEDYIADLVLDDLEATTIEVRASDGLILAAQQDIPVIIKNDILAHEGNNLCIGDASEI